MMVDTHTHLYSIDFGDDADSYINKAIEKGVERFFLPAIDSSTHDAMLKIEAKFPNHIRSMMGLHPCSVDNNWKEELAVVRHHLEKRKFSAIGECGLDYYWDVTYKNEQITALEEQIALAKQYQLPLVLHTRNSIDDAIRQLRPHKGSVKGIFHCFGGSLAQAEAIINLGFKLGIGGVVTYKNAGLAEILKNIDISHLVLETDAPYLAPVPYRGKKNLPEYLILIAGKLAAVKGVSLEQLAEITTENAQELFPNS